MEIIAKRMEFFPSHYTAELMFFFGFARVFISAVVQTSQRPNAAAGAERNPNPQP